MLFGQKLRNITPGIESQAFINAQSFHRRGLWFPRSQSIANQLEVACVSLDQNEPSPERPASKRGAPRPSKRIHHDSGVINILLGVGMNRDHNLRELLWLLGDVHLAAKQ